MPKKNIIFVINDFDIGGAEIMLVKLLTYMDKDKFIISVVCLKSIGLLSSRITSLGIPIYYLKINQWRHVLFVPFKLFYYVKKIKPDVIQSWMYHSDFFSGIAAKCARVPSIIWTIRNNKLAPGRSKFVTRLLVKILARLSHVIPNKIICCATDIKVTHEQIGFDSKKMCVIYNGFDTTLFQRNDAFYKQFREQHPLVGNKFCVGLLGRYHPDKGIDIFLKAAQMVIQADNNVVFVLAGLGLDTQNKELMTQINTLSLRDHLLLLGPLLNTNQFLCGLDIFVSSSRSEGFSNAIGEAMACEVPCIVTDVGDSAYLLSMQKYVVPAGDICALSQSILSMKNEYNERGLRHIGQVLRNRIITHFSIKAIVQQYQQLL